MEFKKVTFDTFKECRDLSPGEHGKDFVAPNTISLAQAYLALDNDECHPMPFAIYKDDVMVGFIMMSYIREDQDDDLDENVYDIWRFMIDEKHQGKGYGKEALLKAVEFLRSKPVGPADHCLLSFVPGNEKAEGLYKSVGFEATGAIHDGEIEMKLKL